MKIEAEQSLWTPIEGGVSEASFAYNEWFGWRGMSSHACYWWKSLKLMENAPAQILAPAKPSPCYAGSARETKLWINQGRVEGYLRVAELVQPPKPACPQLGASAPTEITGHGNSVAEVEPVMCSRAPCAEQAEMLRSILPPQVGCFRWAGR